MSSHLVLRAVRVLASTGLVLIGSLTYGAAPPRDLPASVISVLPGAGPQRGFGVGAERELLTAGGPFAVAGEPGSYAIAWVERQEPLSTLWLAGYEEERRAFTQLVSGGVEPDAGIFLDASRSTIVLAWRARGAWKLAWLDRSEEAGVSGVKIHDLEERGDLRSLALTHDGAPRAVMAFTDKTTVLTELILEKGKTRTLHEFSGEVGAVSLASGVDSYFVVYLRPDSGDLLCLELDRDGKEIGRRKLNTAPVASFSERLGLVADALLVAWVERWPDHDEAVQGRIGRGPSGLAVERQPVSTIGKRVDRIALTPHGERLVAWDEVNGVRTMKLVALDEVWRAGCVSELPADEAEGPVWLLGRRESALLFRARPVGDGRRLLSVRSLECRPAEETEPEWSLGESEQDPVDGGESDPTEGSRIFGDATEPCDGYDNDSDGAIDEGCDSSCEDRQLPGVTVEVTSSGTIRYGADMVWTGSGYGFVWWEVQGSDPDIQNLFFARLDSGGNPLGPATQLTTSNEVNGPPALAWTGTEYGVVWEDHRLGHEEIYFARVDADGVKQGSDVRVTWSTNSHDGPVMVWNGNGYGLIWSEAVSFDREIHFARLSASGVNVGESILQHVVDGIWSNPHNGLDWNGSQYGAVWIGRADSQELCFAAINASGEMITPVVPVVTTPLNITNPRIVWKGDEYGLAWIDDRHGDSELFHARLTTSGSMVSGSELRITTNPGSVNQPRMNWTGSEFGLVWTDDRHGNPEIYHATVSGSSTQIGSNLRITSTEADSHWSRIAWSGTEYGITWRELITTQNVEVHFTRLRCCDDEDSDGYSDCDGDCNDADPEVNQGATEVLDGLDNDCDGYSDDGFDRVCEEPEGWGTDHRITNDAASSADPSLVWTGAEYGVVWPDGRDGNAEVYFSRVDWLGNRVGSEIRITGDDAFDSDRPSVAWSGSEFGVAWHDDRDGNSEIYFARLDPAGASIGSEVRVTADSALSEYPSIVWTGTHYAVAWEDRRDGNREIYFTRMDTAGNKIGLDVRVTTYSGESYRPSLFWTGSDFGVAWHDYRDGNYEIYFARLDEFGNKTVGDLRITNDSASSSNPSLGYSDYEFAIAFTEDRDGNNEIYLTWLEEAGSLTPRERRITNDAASSVSPSLVWTGDEFGLAWQENRDGNWEIYAARAAYSGIKIGSDVRLTNDSSSGYLPAIAWNGREYGVTWYDGRDGGSEIYFTHMRCCDDEDGDGYNECGEDGDDRDPTVNPDAVEVCDGTDNNGDGLTDEVCDRVCDSPEAVGTVVTVNEPTPTVYSLDMVPNGNGFAFVWVDPRDGLGGNQAYFARIDSSGNKIGTDIRVSVLGASSPSLAWTGREYGVAWTDAGLYVARLDAEGNPIGSIKQVTAAGSQSYSPSIVWTGSEYGVAWHEDTHPSQQIYFARLDPAGNEVGPKIQVTHDPADSAWPTLTWTGSEYGLAWIDAREPSYYGIYFARLDGSGSKIGSEVPVTTSVSASGHDITWTGSEFGLTWHQGGFANYEIYFTRLDSTGNNIGGNLRISDHAGTASGPSLAWTGGQYGISWEARPDTTNHEIYFALIDLGGNIIGSELRLSYNTSISGSSRVAWDGESYGVAWRDEQGGDPKILFTLVQCCDDADSDGYDECSGDTNDADPGINPDATKRCDGIDNNGDGVVDEACDASCDDPEVEPLEAQVTDFISDKSGVTSVWTGATMGVAWQDYRHGDGEIYFCNLDSSGNKIGPDVRVTNMTGASVQPVLAWTGSEFGVAFSDYRSGDFELFFARLDSAGGKIGADLRIAVDLYSFTSVALAWSGSEYGLAWADGRDGNSEIYFARLDVSGNKIGSDVRISHSAGPSASPSLAWSGSEFGLSWEDEGNLRFTRLDPRGNKIGSDSVVVVGTGSFPALTWADGRYGLGWMDFRSGSNSEIYFIQLDSSGGVYGSELRISEDPEISMPPVVIWTGAEYALAWSDYRAPGRAVYLARVSFAGDEIGDEIKVAGLSAIPHDPTVAWTGAEYRFVWGDSRDFESDIYFGGVRCCDDMDSDGYSECDEDGNDASVLVNPNAMEVCDGVANNSDYFVDEICDGICDEPERAGAEVRVTNHIQVPAHPDIAWTGSEYASVWSERVIGVPEDMELYLARFDSFGNKIGDNIRVTNDGWDSANPSVVWTGREYGIAWIQNEGGEEIHFARLDESGSMISSDVRLTANDIIDRAPQLTWTGSEYGVVWKGLVDGINQLFFARVDSQGHQIGAGSQLTSDASLYSNELDIVWTGQEFGVVWTDVRSSQYVIYFARIDAQGNMIGTATALSEVTVESSRPAMTWAGTEYGIVWAEWSGTDANLKLVRLDYDGTELAPPALLTNDSSYDLSPSLTWTGREYALAWYDDVSGNNEIYFAPLAADGTMGTAVRISDSGSESHWPGIVWSGSDYGVTWTDNRHGPWEIYFATVACCDDIDSDGYNECEGDTNDTVPTINPDFSEICDGMDNNSDQSIDESCDRECDAPERRGDEVRITEDAALSGSASIAWNGSSYGLTWHDERDGNQEIYFAALDAGGTKIGADVRVTANTGTSASPSMVWAGTYYGVVWRDSSSGNYDIFFKLLDAAGATVQPQRQITQNSGSSYSPSLAWSGSEFGVAWMDDSSGDWEIYFTRIDTSGNKIGSDMRLTDRLGNSWGPALVWDGDGYGLSWQEEGDGVLEIYFMKLDPHGNKIGSDLRLTNDPADSHSPRMAWSGSEYGITWYDSEPGNREIYFARVHEDGYQIGSNIRVTYHSSITSEPNIVWSGSEYGLSWLDNRWGNFEIAFARLDPQGNKIGDNLRISEADGWSEWPRVVWNGSHYAMAWQDERDGNKEIYFASVRCCDDADSDGWTTCAGDSNDGNSRVHPGRTEVCDGVDNNGDGALDEVCDTGCDAAAKWGSEIRETNAAGSSGGASSVWTGAFYGVAWHDDRDGNQEIYFNRYYPDGSAVGSDLRITYALTNSANPSLVWTGEEYGVVFRDAREGNYEIYLARLDRWGSKIGEEVRITYDGGQSYGPELVWNGSEYAVAWMDDRSGNWSLYMARIDRNGNKIGNDMLVSDAASDAWNPSLAWSGGLYGLAWRDNRGTNWELYFTRIDELGNKLAADINLSSEYHDSYTPSLIWNGGEFAISWYDHMPGNSEIYFTRVDEAGTQIGGNVRVTNNGAISAVPSLAWTGTEYGVAWYDRRDNNYEIYYARLDAAGAKIGSDVRISHNNSDSSQYPVVAWDGAEYGIFWQDQRDGNYELYFASVKCCGNDVDSDGYGACDDCDDRIDAINPGETEVCDWIDNNCDTVIDEGFPTPGVTGGLSIAGDKQTLSWNGEPVADGYDVAKGDLSSLHSSYGSFYVSLLDCLENDSGDTQATEPADPAAGQGYYYLVRAVAVCKQGTYDSGQPSQSGLRDSEIDASSVECP